jgi:hypothetical protein
MRAILAGIAGGFIGFIASTVAANLENVPFYTLRSWATWRDNMSDIVAHPADAWVYRTLVLTPIILGVLLGVQINKKLSKPSTR